ncbi:MAG: metal-dependent phosphohydrolase [Merismopedia sp. SIO2A8]|nr:metal-dependent phosphohydrolase [Symploca sp. SIO2B6]NET53012.1 metal-dependent phosphohydrolase [Merismopedia sp. SIO2A8]
MLKGSILGQLRDRHNRDQSQSGEERSPLNFGVYYKNTLVALCHALEDSILTSDCNPLMLTAFQQGKWYLEEAERYGDIAEVAQQIVIMATPGAGFSDHPTSRRDNVSLIDLSPEDPVAQEWHLIIVSPNYTGMVICQEISEADYRVLGTPNQDVERKFYGFWTFEPELVCETAQLAIAHIQTYNPDLATQLATQLDGITSAIQSGDALCSHPTSDQMGQIVQRVVDYLESCQDEVPSGSTSSPAIAIDSSATAQLSTNLVSNELQAFLRLAQLMDQADVTNPMAAAEVAALAESMGQLLDLPGWQLHRLRLAGLLHRFAFLHHSDFSLDTPASNPLTYEPPMLSSTTPPSCRLNPGTQVLRMMPQMRAVATIITHQTERWDGRGYPANLCADEIPLESRILGLVVTFQQKLVDLQPHQGGGDRFNQSLDPSVLEQALAHCTNEAEKRWDPKLLDALTLLVAGLQQGLNLTVAHPKISSGLWLLDNDR